MKKIFLIILLCFLLIGCTTAQYEVTTKNGDVHRVAFTRWFIDSSAEGLSVNVKAGDDNLSVTLGKENSTTRDDWLLNLVGKIPSPSNATVTTPNK